MVELPVRSVFLTLGQLALGVIAALAALVLIAGPRGAARLFGVVAAVAIVIGAAWLIRGLRRQAIILDGTRLGWRGGLTGKVVGWTDLDDVELASTARVSSSITRTHPDVILWTRSGGLHGLRSLLLDRQFPPQMRNGTGTRGPSGVELQPFIVPFSAFTDDHRATISALLDQRGLLPN
jgi:hypothetical protein